MALSLPSSTLKSKPLLKWTVVVILAAVMVAAAIPQYFSGQWPWQSPPDVPQIRAIRELKETGLTLDGWTQDFQQKIVMGGDQWSVQQLTHTSEPAAEQMVIFLRPQGQAKDQPEVEWIDLKGAQQWQTSNQQRLRLGKLNVDTFRALTANQTFAVAQWYALPDGGHPAPQHWFWRDQQYQWTRGERLPWVAVSILVPISPLDDIASLHPKLKSLSQLVQTSLKDNVFSLPTSD